MYQIWNIFEIEVIRPQKRIRWRYFPNMFLNSHFMRAMVFGVIALFFLQLVKKYFWLLIRAPHTYLERIIGLFILLTLSLVLIGSPKKILHFPNPTANYLYLRQSTSNNQQTALFFSGETAEKSDRAWENKRARGYKKKRTTFRWTRRAIFLASLFSLLSLVMICACPPLIIYKLMRMRSELAPLVHDCIVSCGWRCGC